jgi:translation initiation factor 2 alpha subunit (eIF-2alpha)
MENGGKQRIPMSTKTVYRIEVGGELSERYAEAFEGMEMETKSGRTVLTGEVIDDPHLQGILDRISALGLKLVSVQDMSER